MERRRISAAEEKVFRTLERRWSDELRGRRIPPAYRAKMRRDANFQKLVDAVLRGESLAFEDRDLSPDVVRNRDGSVRSRMEAELGGYPADFFCPDCDEPVTQPGTCEKCRTYERRTT